MWICRNRQCKLQKPISEFGIAIAKCGDGKIPKGNSRQCDECVLRRQAAEEEQSRKSAEQVHKKTRTHDEETGQSAKSKEQVAEKVRARMKSAEQAQKKPRKK